jgi:hypothetical protein
LEALADGVLSPDEEASILDMTRALKLTLKFDDENSASAVGRARRAWAVLNRPLPAVESPFRLQNGEVAYLAITAEALEERSRSSSVSYAGPTVSIPIIKGVRFRMGRMAFMPQVTKYMHSFGEGRIVVTNLRIIFASNDKALTAKFKNVLEVQTFTDGLRVTKTTGKPQIFRYAEDRIAGLIVASAWTEAGQ